MPERLFKNKRIWIAGVTVVTLLIVGIIVAACMGHGSRGSKDPNTQVEVGSDKEKNPEKDSEKEPEREFNDSGLSVSEAGEKEDVIDGSASWDGTEDSKENHTNKPAGDSNNKPSSGSQDKPSDGNQDKPADDGNNKPSDGSQDEPSDGGASEDGTLDDGNSWSAPF